MAAQKSSTYSGPFESLYEEHEAMQGNRGNRAAHTAAQAAHSRGLRQLESQGIGRGDTSIYGTNENPIMRMMGMKNAAQYPDPTKNPMYSYRMQPDPKTYKTSMPPSARAMEGKGGFFPSLAGPGPTGAPGFLGKMGDNYAGMREAAGMGIANIASGGAFSSDPNVKMQKFLEQGFSPNQAQNYLTNTARTNARLAQDQFLYGDRSNERGGTQATQATAVTGEVDPTTDPNYIPPHLRYLMEQQQPVTTMNMGGLMALGPMMQQQQYEMGRQMAMRDMGVSV